MRARTVAAPAALARMLVAAFALALATVPLVACGDDPPAAPPEPTGPVDSDLAASIRGGGCYPAALAGTGVAATLNQIVTINPHWAPVVRGADPDADPIVIHGIAHGAHGDTGGDFPPDHVTSDATVSVELDPGDRHYLATGNGALPDARLEIEWESGKWPPWAWPGDGDRVVAAGRWVFDCGHTGATPGHCSTTSAVECLLDSDCQAPSCATCQAGESCRGQHFGYQTELHPPHATAVMRAGRGAVPSTDPGARAVPAVRVDVFVSPDGGAAGDRCVQTHQDRLTDLLVSEDCYPLSQPLARMTKRDFTFDVALPPRPSPSAEATWRLVPQPGGGPAPAAVDVVARTAGADPHLTVTVRTTRPSGSGGAMPTGFAATLYAGWRADPGGAALRHVRLTIDDVEVKNALKPVVPVVREAKGWALQANVNGEFARLDGLDDVHAGDHVAEGLVFDQWLPPDGKLRLVVDGTSRKCIDTLFGHALARSLKELMLASFADCLQTTNQPSSPGVVDRTYAGPDFGSGHAFAVDSAAADGGACATSRAPCVGDGDCPKGEACQPTGTAFTLHFHIDALP